MQYIIYNIETKEVIAMCDKIDEDLQLFGSYYIAMYDDDTAPLFAQDEDDTLYLEELNFIMFPEYCA